MSFTEMIDAVDRQSGLTSYQENANLKQGDTSIIDNIAQLQREQRGGLRSLETTEHELVQLKKAVRHVIPDTTGGPTRIVIKKVAGEDSSGEEENDNRKVKEISSSIPHRCTLPEIDWESEVNSIMIADRESDDEQTGARRANNRSQHGRETGAAALKSVSRLRRALPLSAAGLEGAAPFHPFEVGSLTLSELERGGAIADQEVLLPNRPDLFQYKNKEEEEAAEADVEASSMAAMEEGSTGGAAAAAKGANHGFDGESAGGQQGGSGKQKLTLTLKKEGHSKKKKKLTPEELAEQTLLASMTPKERTAYNKEKKKERLANTSLSGLAHASFELNSAGGKRPDEIYSAKHRSRSLAMALAHNKLAVNKLNTWPDLGSVKLRHFHRPRMPKATTKRKQWKVTFRNNAVIAQNAKNSKKGDGSGGGLQALSVRVGDNLHELSVAGGEAILLEYVEEHPPIRLNYGMASRIINYYRAPDTRNEEDVVEEEDEKRERQEGAQSRRQELYNQCHVPRHVRLLLEHRDRKQDYDHDANIPRLDIGETNVLGPEHESPFLGDIQEEEIVQSVNNNLFRAPIFRQRANKTDYLLICTRAMVKEMHFVVRPLPEVLAVGQIEPLQVCYRPERDPKTPYSNRVTEVQHKFLTLAVARYFAENIENNSLSTGVEYPQIEKHVMSDYTLDRYWSPHRHRLRETLYAIVHELADTSIDRQTGVRRYKPRNFFREDYDENLKMSGIEKEIHFSPEEICKDPKLTPESVCLEEASLAAEFRMREMGIIEALPLPELWRWLQLMGRLRDFKEKKAAYFLFFSRDYERRGRALRRKSASMGAISAETTAKVERELTSLEKRGQNCATLHTKIVEEIKVLDEKVETARFVFDRLLYAPWNTTAAFVHSEVQHDGLGRMEIVGSGDPSGCGKGFAFVRIVHPDPLVGVGGAKKNGAKVYHTNADLRKLTNDEAVKLLVAYGMPYKEVVNLRRWDRITLIRTYATKSALQGLSSDISEKFARLGAVTVGASKESGYKQRCQEVWEKQRAALTGEIDTLMAAVGLDVEGPKDVSSATASSSSSSAPPSTAEQKESDAMDDDDDDDDIDLEIALDDYVEKCVEERVKEVEKEVAEKAAQEAEDERNREREKEQDKRELQSFWEEGKSSVPLPPPIVTSSVTSATTGASGSVAPDRAASASPLLPPGSPRADVPIAVVPGGPTPTHEASSPSGPVLTAAAAAATLPAPKARPVYAPTHAVRKVTRNLHADGTEEIIVTFIIAEKEVRRVRQLQPSLAAPLAGTHGGQAAAVVQSTGPRNVRRRALSMEDEDDQLVYSAPAARQKKKDAPLAIQYGKMKSALTVDKEIKQVYDDGGSAYRKKQSSSRSAGFPVYRMPHVALAGLLESELISLHSAKASKEFWMLWNPVPRSVPRYYEAIKEPISLSDIRENIASYKYLNYASFCYDLDLVVENAKTFNGENSGIAHKAFAIRKRICDNLEQKRRILGLEKCPLHNLEEAIKKKFLYLNRHIDPPPERPYAPAAAAQTSKALPKAPSIPKGFHDMSYAAAASGSPTHSGGMSPLRPVKSIAEIAAQEVSTQQVAQLQGLSTAPPLVASVSFSPNLATTESSSNLGATGIGSEGSLSTIQEMQRIQSFNSHGHAGSQASNASVKSVTSSGSLEFVAGAGGDISPDANSSPPLSDTSHENRDDMSPGVGVYLEDSSLSRPEGLSPAFEGHVASSEPNVAEGVAAMEEEEEEDGDYGEEPAAQEEEESDDDWMVGSDEEQAQEEG